MELVLKVAQGYPQDSGRGIVRLDADALLKLQISPGEFVEIRGKQKVIGRAFRAEKKDWGRELIRMDNWMRMGAGVAIGDKVIVRKVEPAVGKIVTIAPTEQIPIRMNETVVDDAKRQLLHKGLIEGCVVPINFGIPPERIPFVVVSTSPQGPIVVDEITRLEILEKPIEGYKRPTKVAYEDIGGLKDQIQKVRDLIELPLKHPEIFKKIGIEPPKGILLHGPPGTGKTLIAKAVANESGASFFSIAGPEIMSKYYGESEKQLREIFERARRSAPSIIFMDELDSIAPRREDVSGEVERRVVAQLLSLMDGLEERGQVIVIGATNRINAIDPALRRPGRFDREIELPVPNCEEREEILRIHTRNMPLADDVDLKEIASQTHGFVGADLAALCKEAAMKALRRYLPEIELERDFIPPDVLSRIKVERRDFRDAMREIEPSAMREVLVEIPDVRWDDVGGLDEVKEEIREAVEWPLKCPEKFKQMGVKPPKGVLLFGPPGTGKTLIAKAVANEVNANFICVRGPELMSKWVGESERAIREIFRKARQVAPCIIFLDELDAIAPMRGFEEGSRVSERVVNQLLSEMDGLETLEGVVVLAATNRPDILDPALIRPGRFDRLLLVGIPDKDERREILKIHMREMPTADDVDVDRLVELTEGYVGSDIEALCREAAMIALRENFNATQVEMRHFMKALNKVRPTVKEGMMQYYEKVKEMFEGGIIRAKAYEGYR